MRNEPDAAVPDELSAPELEELDASIQVALREDLRAGTDLTSEACVPIEARARAVLVAKQPGCLAGLFVFRRVFELCDPDVRIDLRLADGARVAAGAEVARLEGRARSLLLAERTALNFLQRLSGTATMTARYVALARSAAVAGRPATRILDTRKTTPGLRRLQKHAVLCGGGANHRMGLWDEVMIKDNHLDLAGRSLAEVLPGVRAHVGPDVRITAEARTRAEAEAAIDGGADVVLLDNFTPDQLHELCPLLRARAESAGRGALELEASGGIDETTVAAFAATGVDRISVGALTHSAPALDLSLTLEPLARAASATLEPIA